MLCWHTLIQAKIFSLLQSLKRVKAKGRKSEVYPKFSKIIVQEKELFGERRFNCNKRNNEKTTHLQSISGRLKDFQQNQLKSLSSSVFASRLFISCVFHTFYTVIFGHNWCHDFFFGVELQTNNVSAICKKNWCKMQQWTYWNQELIRQLTFCACLSE